MVTFERTAPPLTEADLNEVEQKLGTSLPKDLRAHYLRYNGGRPNPRFFPKDDDFYDVDAFLSMKTDDNGNSFERTYRSLVQLTPEFPRDCIPFASDQGGDLFLYSVHSDTYGQILFTSHEYYDDPDRYVIYLSASLDEFLASLTDED